MIAPPFSLTIFLTLPIRLDACRMEKGGEARDHPSWIETEEWVTFEGGRETVLEPPLCAGHSDHTSCTLTNSPER